MAPRRIQHDLHQARCRCGKVHEAARPDGVPDSALPIGPNLARAAEVVADVVRLIKTLITAARVAPA
jgi:hypothetical protein